MIMEKFLNNKVAIVTRPNHVVCEATNVDGEKFTVDATELFARAICHEYDHLDGILLYPDRDREKYDLADQSEQYDRKPIVAEQVVACSEYPVEESVDQRHESAFA